MKVSISVEECDLSVETGPLGPAFLQALRDFGQAFERLAEALKGCDAPAWKNGFEAGRMAQVLRAHASENAPPAADLRHQGQAVESPRVKEMLDRAAASCAGKAPVIA